MTAKRNADISAGLGRVASGASKRFTALEVEEAQQSECCCSRSTPHFKLSHHCAVTARRPADVSTAPGSVAGGFGRQLHRLGGGGGAGGSQPELHQCGMTALGRGHISVLRNGTAVTAKRSADVSAVASGSTKGQQGAPDVSCLSGGCNGKWQHIIVP
jgi:hypothetical protein